MGWQLDEHRPLRGGPLVDAWGDYLSRVPWQYFVTMTFDPKRLWPVSRKQAMAEGERWCNLVAYTTRRPVAWACVGERGRSGLWHAHALLAGARRAPWLSLRTIWEARNGRMDYRSVFDVPGIALYASKTAAREAVRGVNYFCLLATTTSAGPG